jgi:hypothetical protein
MSIRPASLLLLLLWQAAPRDEPPVAQPDHMRYRRMLSVPSGDGQVCTVLDAQIFPHAEPSLKDLRVFPLEAGPSSGGPSQSTQVQTSGPHEAPYAITLSETTSQDIRAAKVLNLGTSGKSGGGSEPLIVFDLEMPERPYTDVILGLGGADFLATATVSGMETLGGKTTALGVFTLFDLTAQRLSRDTTLPLPESTFRFLHVSLSVSPAPGTKSQAEHFGPAMVEGAEVPPSREAQTIYTTVATVAMPTAATPPSLRKTRFDFVLPLRVPVERVSFDLPPAYAGNFSRDVIVKATPDSVPGNVEGMALPTEAIMGTISRVHTVQAGRRINEEALSLPATIGSNLQSAAHVSVEVDNGDDLPLPIAAVRLEMRQRKLCFDAPANLGAGIALYYGDPALLAPVYDYQRLFAPSDKALVAMLGPEQLNPEYHPPPAEARSFTERHPEVLWIALIAVICALGTVALKSSRNVGR